jgi:hypothetical protein
LGCAELISRSCLCVPTFEMNRPGIGKMRWEQTPCCVPTGCHKMEPF